MAKPILVATDGPEGANRVIDFAANFAKKLDGELVIVNVIGGYGLPAEMLGRATEGQHVWLDEMLASLSAQALAKARDRARDLGVGVVLLESRAWNVAETIIEIARGKGADEIVVGQCGASGVVRLLLGSVSQKLVSLSPLPVVVVPRARRQSERNNSDSHNGQLMEG